MFSVYGKAMNNNRLYLRHLTHLVLAATIFAASSSQASEYWEYVVQPGDNLWSLSEEYLASMRYWRSLQRLNRVTEPRRLPPGMRLKIPTEWLRIAPSGSKVLELQGQPQARRLPSGELLPLQAGSDLRSGDTIVTGPSDSVTLEFPDGSRLLLQAESELALEALEAYGDRGNLSSRLRLRKGNADTQVETQKPGGGRFEIHTPAAISAVRGTEFRVGVEDGGRLARTEALAGVVEVTGSGRRARLPAGFGTLAELGKGPRPPVPLLSPPDLGDLPAVVTRLPAGFSVPAMAGAASYRWQLSDREDFASLLQDRRTSAPSVTLPGLVDGAYFLRVRAVDKNGIQGRDAVHGWRLDAHPEPPFLIEPRQGADVYGERPEFQWAAPESARSFVFQLARDEAFALPVFDLPEQSGDRLSAPQDLPPGDYFWRIASRDGAGKQGPFSDPQRFRLREVPKAPTPETAEAGKDQLALRWRAGPPGQTYHLQLARDRNFEELVVDQRVPESEVVLPRPASGIYYMRIRATDAQGYQGPFGEVHRLDVSPASYWPFLLFGVGTLLLVL